MSKEIRYEIAPKSSIYSRETPYGRRLAATGKKAIFLLTEILGEPHEYEKNPKYPVWKIQTAFK